MVSKGKAHLLSTLNLMKFGGKPPKNEGIHDYVPERNLSHTFSLITREGIFRRLEHEEMIKLTAIQSILLSVKSSLYIQS